MQNFGGSTSARTSRATLIGTPPAPDVKGTGIPAPALMLSQETLLNAKSISPNIGINFRFFINSNFQKLH